MTVIEIHEKLKAAFGDAIGPLSEARVDPSAAVAAPRIAEVARFLKSTPGLELDHCDDLTAVDWPQREVVEVVYHLFSYRYRHGVVLRAELPRARPELPSVTGVWKAANWLERECYDMFGVVFAGHPDLRRVLLPDDWKGHPLRKDYAPDGGYHGISADRENPLVELRRLDEQRRAARPPPATPPAAAAPAAPPPPAPAAPPRSR